MATIGTFTKTGRVPWPNHHPQRPGEERPHGPRDQPLQRERPSHRVYVGRVEIGAAWAKRSNEGRDYLGLKLDDPSFTAPIYANLFDDEGGEGYSLIWSRPNGAAPTKPRLLKPRPARRAGVLGERLAPAEAVRGERRPSGACPGTASNA